MNLVEIYLKELISVEEFTPENYPDLTLVKVNAIWDCHGNIHQQERTMLLYEWEAVQKQGYFLG